jgi:2-keto-4-pentenoate hydratase/2-oxohepta-3-ene-1,7-dioic acid hydratase in catechol pathway
MRIARLALPARPPAFAILERDAAKLLDRAPWLGGTPTGETIAWANSMLLAPVEPSKIICVGRNYAAHAKELGHDLPIEPLLFFKPPSAVVGPGDDVFMPTVSERVDHEAELTLVIGSRAKNLTKANALAHLAGITAANDVTARDLQKKDGQWARAKGFDTFCPLGPWVDTRVDDAFLASLEVRCEVDGVERQRGRTAHMIFDVPTVLAYVSAIFTLEPGDVILTGTPEGVAPLDHGARCTVSVHEADGREVFSMTNRFLRP